ncbi:MAG: cysteine hydrolase, partial [Thaumarchaeota archaeon]
MSFPEILKLPEKLKIEEARVDPSSAALLIIDVQNDFANPSGKLYARGAEKVIPPIKKLASAARRSGATVIYTQDWHIRGDPEFEIWGEHTLAGTWGAEIVDEL